MTAAETAQKIERARRRREDELLLLLLMLSDEARRDSIVLVKHGVDPQQAIASTFARAVPVISGAMADAHTDAFGRFGRLTDMGIVRSDAGELTVLMAMYDGQARAAAQAMARTSYAAIQEIQAKFPDESAKLQVNSAFDNVGYTRSSSFGLDQGAERAIVQASNVGMISAARRVDDAEGRGGSVLPRQAIGLTHLSIVDGRTTDICLDRAGLTLPCTDPYWAQNCPPLHPRCRSIIVPVMGAYEADTVYPTIPPDPGWGLAPAGFLEAFMRAA